MISLVFFIDKCVGALSQFVWHLAALRDCIEDVGELKHTLIPKVFECLSRCSICYTALTILHFVQLSFYLFTRFDVEYLHSHNCILCLENVRHILSAHAKLRYRVIPTIADIFSKCAAKLRFRGHLNVQTDNLAPYDGHKTVHIALTSP